MNKKQLEKEVLRLKSAGLTKDQIKNILTKDVNGKPKPKPEILLSDILNDYYSGFTTNKKPVKSSFKIENSGDVSYKFSNGEGFYILITDGYRDGVLASSSYAIGLSRQVVDINYSARTNNDIFRYIEPNNSSLTLFYALRGLCLGIFDEHKNTAIQDSYLVRNFIDNIRTNTIEDLKEDLGFNSSFSHYYDLNA